MNTRRTSILKKLLSSQSTISGGSFSIGSFSPGSLSSGKTSSFESVSQIQRERRSEQFLKEDESCKDNAAATIDLECQIQAERITKILDNAIYRTKMALAFPTLLHQNILYETLTPEDFNELIDIFEYHETQTLMIPSSVITSLTSVVDSRQSDISGKMKNTVLNPELSRVVHILPKYETLRPNVEQIVAGLKTSKCPALDYLQTLEQFRDLMVERMKTTAEEDLTEKLNTRKLKRVNNELIAKIEEIKKQIEEEQKNFEDTMGDKENIKERLKQKISFADRNVTAKLQQKVKESEHVMHLKSQEHRYVIEKLKKMHEDAKEAFDKYLHTCLTREKDNRLRRMKIETQLSNWIQKYDTEMTVKQQELDEFIAKYEKESKKIEQLEKELEDQNKEYGPLMVEKEAEYQQELENKMNAFLLEHACRVIQNAWRQVLLNRAEKKKQKGRGKKGKKKA